MYMDVVFMVVIHIYISKYLLHLTFVDESNAIWDGF